MTVQRPPEILKETNGFVGILLTWVIVLGMWAFLAWIPTIWLSHLSYGAAVIAVPVGAIIIWIVVFVGEELRWRLITKSNHVNDALWLFKNNDFPIKRYYPDRGPSYPDHIIDIYLAAIQRDERMSAETRIAAARLDEGIRMRESIGMSHPRRRRAELNEALDIYAPRDDSPEWRG